MRFYEIITESIYTDELKNEIINLLSIASARGMDKFQISHLIKNLKNYGIDADVESVTELLNGLQIVSSVDNDMIVLNAYSADDISDEFSSMDQEEISPSDELDVSDTDIDDMSSWEEDRVDTAAKRQAKKGL